MSNEELAQDFKVDEKITRVNSRVTQKARNLHETIDNFKIRSALGQDMWRQASLQNCAKN